MRTFALFSGRPTLPVISLNGKGLTVKEGGFRRFTCKSHSTTNPRNPDEPLLFRFIVNGMKVTEMTTQARFMEGYNELMVADITKADSHLNITCIVWEGDERELSSNNMRSFTLHVIDKIKCKFFTFIFISVLCQENSLQSFTSRSNTSCTAIDC